MSFDDPFLDSRTGSNGLLSPSSSKNKKSPSLSNRRSTASLQQSQAPNHDAAGHHSLAHELAVALMPEPLSGPKSLAAEFGIEFDEGAEGLDQDQDQFSSAEHLPASISFMDERNCHHDVFTEDAMESEHSDHEFGSPQPHKRIQHDAMEILTSNFESTDQFLVHLRQIDVHHTKTVVGPSIETLASSIIRRLNDASKEREDQVRALLSYEREFRKIAAELGGGDVLAEVDALEDWEDDGQPVEPFRAPQLRLDTVIEESSTPSRNPTTDWEVNQDDDDGTIESSPPSPTKISNLPPAPPDPASASSSAYISQTVPHLTHTRQITTSLLSSFNTISELCQINGAGTADAGRKIRALKSKMGEWRADADLADQSRKRVEKWETGIDDSYGGVFSPSRRRVDGRKVVKDHLAAFEGAVGEASRKTQAIMAAS